MSDEELMDDLFGGAEEDLEKKYVYGVLDIQLY